MSINNSTLFSIGTMMHNVSLDILIALFLNLIRKMIQSEIEDNESWNRHNKNIVR